MKMEEPELHGSEQFSYLASSQFPVLMPTNSEFVYVNFRRRYARAKCEDLQQKCYPNQFAVLEFTLFLIITKLLEKIIANNIRVSPFFGVLELFFVRINI
jgi:hypothetical protein